MSVMAALTRARKVAGVSQEQMGRDLGVSQVAVLHWESTGNSRREIKLVDAQRYAAALGLRLAVQPDDLEPDFASCLEGMLKAMEFTSDETFWPLHARLLRQLAAQAWQRVNPHTPDQKFADLLDRSSLGTPQFRETAAAGAAGLAPVLTGVADEQAEWEAGM